MLIKNMTLIPKDIILLLHFGVDVMLVAWLTFKGTQTLKAVTPYFFRLISIALNEFGLDSAALESCCMKCYTYWQSWRNVN